MIVDQIALYIGQFFFICPFQPNLDAHRFKQPTQLIAQVCGGIGTEYHFEYFGVFFNIHKNRAEHIILVCQAEFGNDSFQVLQYRLFCLLVNVVYIHIVVVESRAADIRLISDFLNGNIFQLLVLQILRKRAPDQLHCFQRFSAYPLFSHAISPAHFTLSE